MRIEALGIGQGHFCCCAGRILGTLPHRVDNYSCIESMHWRVFIIFCFLFYMKAGIGLGYSLGRRQLRLLAGGPSPHNHRK